jgi:hypothetical protein
MLLMVVLVAQVLHLPLQVHLLLTQVAVAAVAQLLAEQVVLGAVVLEALMRPLVETEQQTLAAVVAVVVQLLVQLFLLAAAVAQA